MVKSLTKVCQTPLKKSEMRNVKPLSEYQKGIYGEILREFFNPIFSTTKTLIMSLVLFLAAFLFDFVFGGAILLTLKII